MEITSDDVDYIFNVSSTKYIELTDGRYFKLCHMNRNTLSYKLQFLYFDGIRIFYISASMYKKNCGYECFVFVSDTSTQDCTTLPSQQSEDMFKDILNTFFQKEDIKEPSED